MNKLYDANIKWIEDIIEIILANTSCEHQERHETDLNYDVHYCLDNEKETIKKCVKAIPEVELKLEVDEKLIQEKTMEMVEIISKGKILEAMSFIRSFIRELEEKIKCL